MATQRLDTTMEKGTETGLYLGSVPTQEALLFYFNIPVLRHCALLTDAQQIMATAVMDDKDEVHLQRAPESHSLASLALLSGLTTEKREIEAKKESVMKPKTTRKDPDPASYCSRQLREWDSSSFIFAKMTELLNSILTVIKVFQKYANKNGDSTSLCKEELKQLLFAEFGDILRRPNDPDTVETILSLLDRNRNEHVDFHEYLLMVFQLAQACYHSLDNESSGDRTSQQERKQEETQDHKFPRNTGRQHRKRLEGERQDSCHSQSEKLSQDTHQDRSEREDKDSHYGQTEGQDQDSSSGQRLSNKSGNGNPERQGYVFALNQYEKQLQDSHYGQSDRLGQQSSYGQSGRLREDPKYSHTNQQESGSYNEQPGRLGQESGCGQRNRQELDSHYGQTDRQGLSSHYGQTDRQGLSTQYGQRDRQGLSSHYGQTDRQGLSSQY
ncbi:hypothetical protein Celaphus_00002011, partial [Cervus elaphus hippelaphus]